MQPTSIKIFERLYLSAVLIEIVRMSLEWPLLMQGNLPALCGRVAAIVISLSLLLLASRRGMRVAALLLAALFIIGLPIGMQTIASDRRLAAAVALGVQIALQTVALLMLLRQDGRQWLKAGRKLPTGN